MEIFALLRFLGRHVQAGVVRFQQPRRAVGRQPLFRGVVTARMAIDDAAMEFRAHGGVVFGLCFPSLSLPARQPAGAVWSAIFLAAHGEGRNKGLGSLNAVLAVQAGKRVVQHFCGPAEIPKGCDCVVDSVAGFQAFHFQLLVSYRPVAAGSSIP